jgi:ATP-dependent Clp protease protease subunit
MLEEVKESIINAYEIKTSLSRSRLSHLMDAETWMNAKKAIELGFADGMLEDEKKDVSESAAYSFSGRAVAQALFNKLVEKTKAESAPAPVPEQEPAAPEGRSVDELKARLEAIKKFM